MFFPEAGGLRFEQAWALFGAGEPYDRCGPALGVDGEGKAKKPCFPAVDSPSSGQALDVDVDQETGEVFVLNVGTPGSKLIVAYSADGSKELTRFGEEAPSGETIAESPQKLHDPAGPGGLAVGKAGVVYVYDQEGSQVVKRLMAFKPNGSGGYEYAGTAEDIGVGNPHRPTRPVADAAGHLYVASNSTFVEEYDPAHPAAAPVCTYEQKKGGITSITVNPLTGEPYFYSSRISEGFKTKTVHQLGPCNPATGKFEGPKGEAKVGQFEVTPERAELYGLAYDPADKLEATRAAGILYGGAPAPVPAAGLGTGEPGQSSLGYVFAAPKAQDQPAKVGGESVAKVTATGAELRAEINPEGIETAWRFEYETQAQFEADGESFAGAAEAPLGGGTLPNQKAALTVTAALAGLTPDTAYRYRVVAKSKCSTVEPEKNCPVEGQTQAFHTFPATLAGLSDGRAWELVSPVRKNGGQVFPAEPQISSCGAGSDCKPGFAGGRFPMQSAPGGDAVAYEGSAFGNEGASNENAYVARRDPVTGWQTVNPTPQLLRSKISGGYKAYSPDLGQGLVAQEQTYPALSPAAPPAYENLYGQPTTSPFAVSPLMAGQPPHRNVLEFLLTYAGASTDLSRVFFAANDALTAAVPGIAPAALDGGAAKYNLYEFHAGQLALVNVAPGNASTKAGASFGAGGAQAISEDGSRAFWSSETGQVFVREGAKATVAIPGSGPAAKFLAAAGDGSKVLLTNGSLYDLETKASTDLTAGKGGFLGLLGQSEDLSHAYFVDTAVLTGAEQSCREGVGGEEICEAAQAGKDNLYARSGATTSFVARLAAGDNGGGLAHDWEPLPSQRTAEASPQGRYLAFLSQAPLSGYDNTGPCEGKGGAYVPAPCPEVFLYDSQTQELSCPSCNPSGERPFGWSVLRRLHNSGGWSPQPRYLFDSGRLYFDSQDSLSLADTNEGWEDVYQYEPAGVGSCEREGGCVSLLSAGHEATDSNLFAVDATGKNVFFTTRDRLALKDTDDLIDLYDAREGGGIAAESETGRGECQGEACQGPPVSAPNDPTPGSSGFEGAGNVTEQPTATPKPCAKGKVKRRGKCVARKHRHNRKRAAHRNGRKSR
jgi:hypothetical protein